MEKLDVLLKLVHLPPSQGIEVKALDSTLTLEMIQDGTVRIELNPLFNTERIILTKHGIAELVRLGYQKDVDKYVSRLPNPSDKMPSVKELRDRLDALLELQQQQAEQYIDVQLAEKVQATLKPELAAMRRDMTLIHDLTKHVTEMDNHMHSSFYAIDKMVRLRTEKQTDELMNVMSAVEYDIIKMNESLAHAEKQANQRFYATLALLGLGFFASMIMSLV